MMTTGNTKQAASTAAAAAFAAMMMIMIMIGHNIDAASATTVGTVGATRIAGYQTKSSVTGSAIDLDQAEMERHLDAGEFDKAEQVFRNGAHMKPYAVIHLEKPTSHDVILGSGYYDQNHVRIVGLTEEKSADGGEGEGGGGGDIVDAYMKLKDNKIPKGYTNLYINYQVTEDQYRRKQIPCAVGGRDQPNMDGCLASRGGLIIEGYGAVNYHYDPKTENGFASTLFGFSEHEAEKMFHCKDHCPYPEYEKFYQYYGQMDYGNLWIAAALEGKPTTFSKGIHFTNGNEDFSLLGDKGRAEAVKTATVTMNVFTQVNRIMTESSVDKCHEQCGSHEGEEPCPQAAEPWDDAVATYVGSLEGSDGTGQGYLLYGLADQLCQDFSTCGPDKKQREGTSSVNLDIIRYFQEGRRHLETGYCDEAQRIKFKVDQRMTIPLVQATLRSAYRLEYTHKNSDEERGRAVAYLASILPDLNFCNTKDAQIVYDQMNLSATGTPDFAVIKESFERNYDCMSIQCEDVGGLIDSKTGNYYKGAEPCTRRLSSSGSRNQPPPSSSSSATYTKSDRVKSFASNGFMMFIACNVVILVALVVKRSRWVPALSSQIDSVLSRSTRSSGGLSASVRSSSVRFEDPTFSLDTIGGGYEPVAASNTPYNGGIIDADTSERSQTSFHTAHYDVSERDYSDRDYSNPSTDMDFA